jgi:hypothetical protein
MMEQLVEWRLAEETELLGENLPQSHIVHHKSHLPDAGSNPGRRGGKPATNHLSYGAAIYVFTCDTSHLIGLQVGCSGSVVETLSYGI